MLRNHFISQSMLNNFQHCFRRRIWNRYSGKVPMNLSHSKWPRNYPASLLSPNNDCSLNGLYTVCKFKKFPPGNLFFVSTVEKFQILEYGFFTSGIPYIKFPTSAFLQFLRIWFNFFKISGWKLFKFEVCRALHKKTSCYKLRC